MSLFGRKHSCPRCDGKIVIDAFELAQRFIGMKEIPGKEDNPNIMAMLTQDQSWPKNDEVPWCSAFMNRIAWLLRLPRSKDLRARSWLEVGKPIRFVEDAKVGFDVIILKRGGGKQPGADVIAAPGHVGWYAGHEGGNVQILGGNQSNMVSIIPFSLARLLGIRRLRG